MACCAGPHGKHQGGSGSGGGGSVGMQLPCGLCRKEQERQAKQA